MNGSIQADQDTSFQAMDRMLLQMVNIVDGGSRRRHGATASPAAAVAAAINTARMFISLKPLEERKITRRSGHRAAAPEAGANSRGNAVSCRPPRIFASAAGRATRNINSRCAATICRI